MLIFSTIVIQTGVTLEKNLGGVSSIFTGRGLLWGQAVDKILNGPTIKFYFGYPTSKEELLKEFGDYNIGNNESQIEHMGRILEGGNFHNGLVYTLYNTGVVGFVLFIVIMFNCFRLMEYNINNLNAFNGAFVIYLLNGRSLYGIYILSILLLIILSVKLEKSQNTHSGIYKLDAKV